MRSTLGAAAIAVLAVVCYAGLPLATVAGLSTAALTLAGGLTAGMVAVTIVAIRVRAARPAACPVPVRSAKEIM